MSRLRRPAHQTVIELHQVFNLSVALFHLFSYPPLFSHAVRPAILPSFKDGRAAVGVTSLDTVNQPVMVAEMSETRVGESSAEGARNRRAGRAKSDTDPTVQVSLRLPSSQINALRERAYAVGRVERSMITPQEIMRRMITKALAHDDTAES